MIPFLDSLYKLRSAARTGVSGQSRAHCYVPPSSGLTGEHELCSELQPLSSLTVYLGASPYYIWAERCRFVVLSFLSFYVVLSCFVLVTFRLEVY